MKSDSLFHSFKYAIAGFISAFKSERNLKIHTFITILIVIAGFYFKISALEWIALIITITIVVGSELFNTALEETVNIASPKINPHAKLAKDISAAAVFLPAISAVIIGLIIFVPKILTLFN